MRKNIFYSAIAAACALLLSCGNPAAPPPIPEGTVMLDKTNFSSLTNVAGRISMIDFYMPGFPVSEAMDGGVARIAERYRDTVLVGKVDCQADDWVQFQFDIMAFPTFLFLDGGKEARRLVKTREEESPEVMEDSLIIIIDSLLAAK